MPILLQINSNAVIGSTGRIADQLGDLAIQNGWVSYIAYGRHVGKSKSHLIKIGNKVSIGFHFLFSRLFDRHGFGSYFATQRFIRKVKKIKPDIVHLHNIHGYYINVKLLFQYLDEADIPIVWTLHDFWTITGHCAYIPQNCTAWKNGCNECKCNNTYPKSIINNSSDNWKKKRLLFNLPDKIVITPVSEWLSNHIKKSILANHHIHIIYNGIDVSKFSSISDTLTRERYNIENKFILLGVATKWTTENGFDQILDFSKKLDKDEVIILVGVNASQQKELPNNVIGIAETNSLSELVEIYNNADILLNISSTVTFGLVTVEAMACGTPVIVQANTAGEEIITTNTGFIINDIIEVLPIIKEVKTKGKSHYSEACRKRAVEMFDKEVKFSEYLNLYEEISNGTFVWKKH